MWAAVAAWGWSCPAQVMQAPGTMPGRRFPVPPVSRPETTPQQPTTAAATTQLANPAASVQTGAAASSATTPTTAPSTAPNLPPSLLDKPAGPAHVTLSKGTLAVDAHNSSLSEILRDLESSSGMMVDGFDKDSRIFGVYGPGPPRDVLSSLLDGAGYNFLMVGSTDAGTPREIVLTERSNAPVSAPQQGSGFQQENQDDGANNYPPLEEVQPPPPNTDQPRQEPPRPRSPQEMLLELQRLRQQQQQQEQQQPQ